MIFALVALAGGIGAVVRYLVDRLVAGRWAGPFPLGTLVVNVSGSAAFGALVGAIVAGRVAPEALTWGGLGFLGAYTTFSTFTFETLRLLEDGAWRHALWNLLLSGPLSFAAAAAGYLAAR
ncbi:MAG: hypothetical protein GEV03_28235 [Streptosporangiales bacterium]|nr:hypothetical protein [Streptosporangiales bacterium]